MCLPASFKAFIKARCTARTIFILNLIACVLMLICIGLRFYYLSLPDTIPGNNIVFFVILTIYLLIFIGLIVAAEFKREKPRLYFDFLDRKFGRSSFIAFTQLLILETSGATEIILAIIVFSIALAGMAVGWGEGPDGINSSLPPSHKKERESAAPPS